MSYPIFAVLRLGCKYRLIGVSERVQLLAGYLNRKVNPSTTGVGKWLTATENTVAMNPSAKIRRLFGMSQRKPGKSTVTR
jgi:hypothetical protein